jgi:kynurenine formamidase
VSGRDADDVSQVPPGRLIGPAVVIDMSQEAAEDPDFLLEVEHIQEWEMTHGPLPDGGWLLYRTGWDARSGDQADFLNANETGPHTPGFSTECSQWPPFPCHTFLLGANKYGLTQLRNLDRLPPTGAVLIAAPLPIVAGSGSPARVLALVQR